MNDLQTIRKYVTGELSDAQRREFEQRLASDPELKFLVDNFPAISDISDTLIEDDLLNVMQAEERSASSPTGMRRMSRWLPAAAAAILLFIAFFIFFNQSPNPDRLFAEHFVPYAAGAERGSAGVEEGLAAYHRGDFAEAIEVWKSLDWNQETNHSIQLLLASAHMDQLQTAQAISLLKAIITRQDLRFKEPAEWYLALAHLQSDDLDTSQQVLQQIIDKPTHGYFEKAQALLKKLD